MHNERWFRPRSASWCIAEVGVFSWLGYGARWGELDDGWIGGGWGAAHRGADDLAEQDAGGLKGDGAILTRLFVVQTHLDTRRANDGSVFMHERAAGIYS